MSPSEVVSAFIAAIEQKDVAAAAAMVASDISYENMPITPIVGVEGMVETLNNFLNVAGEVEWIVVAQDEVGNRVYNERMDRFQIGDGWLELPIAGVFEVNDDGLITLWRDYFDMGSYLQQFAKLTGIE